MILHFEINGQPRNNLRCCTTRIDAYEIENLFSQAPQSGFFLCSFGHDTLWLLEVYEEGLGEPRGVPLKIKSKAD